MSEDEVDAQAQMSALIDVWLTTQVVTLPVAEGISLTQLCTDFRQWTLAWYRPYYRVVNDNWNGHTVIEIQQAVLTIEGITFDKYSEVFTGIAVRGERSTRPVMHLPYGPKGPPGETHGL